MVAENSYRTWPFESYTNLLITLISLVNGDVKRIDSQTMNDEPESSDAACLFALQPLPKRRRRRSASRCKAGV